MQEAADNADDAYAALKGVVPSAKTAASAKHVLRNELLKEGYKPRFDKKMTAWLGEVDDVADDVLQKRAPV
ncbi:MAG TPA: hypothetical protein VNA25_05305, partial [Phycisphaerae bacterium]|nr:hypothetical protein [Phycisphaerae bacterium]